MKRYQINRLEQALQYWEELCFLGRYALEAGRGSGKDGIPAPAGPLIHYRELRNHLLERGDFDADRFFRPTQIAHDYLRQFASIPQFLHAWSSCSRRVYQVTQELQLLLGATSLEGIAWNDITWPFNAFALMFDVPIIDGHENKLDFALVYVDEHQGLMSSREGLEVRVMLFSEDFERFTPFSHAGKKQILRAVKRRRWSEVSRLVDKCTMKWRGNMSIVTFGIFSDPSDSHLVTTPRSERMYQDHRELGLVPFDQEDHPEYDVATRIIAGLCLYLTSLPSGSSHRSSWQSPPRGRPDPKAVTNGAEVCTVTNIHKLGSRLQRALESDYSGREMPAGWRCGHWRRPPGKGDDPIAKKTVLVHPYEVRKDRLGDDELPGGTKTVV